MAPLWILSLLALLRASPAPCAPALCACQAPPTPSAARAEAAAVFVGTVTEVRDTVLREGGVSLPVRAVVLRRERSWKGELPRSVTVLTGRGGGDCGFPFRPGTRYLVYAHGEAGSLSTDVCSRTRAAADAREELARLGAGATR